MSSEYITCRQQAHADSKSLLQQNPQVLNWGYQLTQVVLYNGGKIVVVAVAVAVAVVVIVVVVVVVVVVIVLVIHIVGRTQHYAYTQFFL